MPGPNTIQKPRNRFVDPKPNQEVFKLRAVNGGFQVEKFVKGKLTVQADGTVFAKKRDAERYFFTVANVGDVLR